MLPRKGETSPSAGPGGWLLTFARDGLGKSKSLGWLLLVLAMVLQLGAARAQTRPKRKGKQTTTTSSVSRKKAVAKTTATRRTNRQPAQNQPKNTRRTNSNRTKTKEQLERERQANLREIQQTSQALNQTQEKKKVSLGQLSVIKEKLTVKQGVIQTISTQLHGLESEVHQTTQQVVQTQKNLSQLKSEYARLLYTASKTSNSFNRLMFLFAAESFNQFALRLRYIRQYTEERQQQAARIMGTQQRLNQQLTGLTVQRRRKSSLLTTQLSENKNLLSLKTQQDEMVEQLGQQEQGLRRELETRQQAVRQLDNLIAQRVREEIARAARAARLAARRAAAAARRETASRRSNSSRSESRDDATASPESDAPETAAEVAADRRVSRVVLTPETALLSSSFSGNRGRLPWPVGHGFVSQRFGRHPHPVLKNVIVDNRGIDIQTNPGEAVRACFDGKVLTIASIAGMNTIVMIQHGDFFTVYAKLRSVNVSEGQHVSAREVIGTVATGSEGTAELQFQVWHNSANLNPQSWLGRR